jgi:hypothetical protein
MIEVFRLVCVCKRAIVFGWVVWVVGWFAGLRYRMGWVGMLWDGKAWAWHGMAGNGWWWVQIIKNPSGWHRGEMDARRNILIHSAAFAG